MSSASSSGWGIASNGGKAPPHPPTARRHVEPPAGVPFQHEGLKKIHNTYFGILGQQFRLSPNLKAQQRKNPIRPTIHVRRLSSPPPLCLFAPSPVASTQSPQSSLRLPNPPTPILSSTLAVSCHLPSSFSASSRRLPRLNPKSPILSPSPQAPNPNPFFDSHGFLPSPPLQSPSPVLWSPKRNSLPLVGAGQRRGGRRPAGSSCRDSATLGGEPRAPSSTASGGHEPTSITI
jgi:hypothetical protein